MWTPEIVRIRFVEAAGTERFLSTLRLPTAKGYWPEFQYDQDDHDGWDKKAKEDHLAIWQGRGTAKADALSRHQECLSWTIERITDPERRRLVWGFAFCRAYKREFGKWCEKRGKAKSTAYNRLHRIWRHLSDDFNNERLLLRDPSPYWVGHETPLPVRICATDASRAPGPAPIKFTPGYQTEKSRDLLNTPEAIADFTKHRDLINADRRRFQRRLEAKRREKLGLIAS